MTNGTTPPQGPDPGQGATAAPPPMVRPDPALAGDIPIRVGPLRTIGMKVKSKDNGFYFLAQEGAFVRRYARRFPLTAEGWARCWAEFAEEDPEGAAAYHQWLARPTRPRPPAPQEPDHSNDAGLTCLVGGTFGMIVGFILLDASFHEPSEALFVIAGTVFILGLVAAFFVAVVEGVRLAMKP